MINKAFDLISTSSSSDKKSRDIIYNIIENEYENYLKNLDKNIFKYIPKICLCAYVSEYAQANGKLELIKSKLL